MTKIIRLALLLALVLILFAPVPVLATSAQIAASVVQYNNAVQNHSFYAQGMEWVFYRVGTTWYYKTGTGNGTSWSAAISLTGDAYEDIYYDGSQYVHCAGHTLSSGNGIIYYRRGEPLGNGSITWTSAPVTVVSADTCYRTVSVTCSSTGYPAVSIFWYSNPYYEYSGVQLYASTTNDGSFTWTEGSHKHLTDIGNFPYWTGHHLYSLSDGKMVCILAYSAGGAYHRILRAYQWDGAAWVDPGVTSGAAEMADPCSWSGVAWGDGVRLVFLSSAYDIKSIAYNGATNTFGSDGYTVPGAGASAYPVLGGDYSLGYLWLYWSDASMTTIWGKLYVDGVWSSSSELVDNETGVLYIFADADIPFGVKAGAYYWTSSGYLYYFDAGGIVDTLSGLAIDATDITAYSATLNALCSWDGGGNVTALFMYGCPVQDGNVTYEGYVTSGEYFSGNVTGLIPSQTYGFWVVFTNEDGEYWSNLVYFNTAAESGYSVPLVVTNPLNPVLDISETSARLYGYLSYDGNLDCQVGFQYRIKGVSTWSTGWNSGIYHTASQIRATLSNLQKNKLYEYRAIARNAMNLPDAFAYGVTLEFTTSYYSPTPSGGGIPGLPVVWSELFKNLGSSVKLMLAIIINIGAVVVVAWKLGTSKAAGIAALATGLGLVILFVSIGWYPTWVILLIAAIVGLLVFFTLLGRK